MRVFAARWGGDSVTKRESYFHSLSLAELVGYDI